MDMTTGKGVRPDKAEKALTKAHAEIVEGEAVLFFAKCINLRPSVDAVVLTNARVLGLNTTEGKFKFRARYDEVESVRYDEKRGFYEVRSIDGQSATFKGMAPEDVSSVAQHVEHGRQQPIPANVRAALEATSSSTVLSVVQGTPKEIKAAKRTQKEEAKAERSEQQQLQAAADREKHGSVVAKGWVDYKSVAIYRNGYVKVSGGKVERLVAIEASADVTKKTGLGRGVGVVMSGGISALSPNKRGDIYLTIVTDKSTHVLHEDPPTSWGLKASKKLAAAGNAVINSNTAHPAGSDQSSHVPPPHERPADNPPSASRRLTELAQMRDDGLISAEEFEQVRAKVLGTF